MVGLDIQLPCPRIGSEKLGQSQSFCHLWQDLKLNEKHGFELVLGWYLISYRLVVSSQMRAFLFSQVFMFPWHGNSQFHFVAPLSIITQNLIQTSVPISLCV